MPTGWMEGRTGEGGLFLGVAKILIIINMYTNRIIRLRQGRFIVKSRVLNRFSVFVMNVTVTVNIQMGLSVEVAKHI